MTERRVIVLVDGFNLYHAVDELDLDPYTHRPLHKKQLVRKRTSAERSTALALPECGH